MSLPSFAFTGSHHRGDLHLSDRLWPESAGRQQPTSRLLNREEWVRLRPFAAQSRCDRRERATSTCLRRSVFQKALLTLRRGPTLRIQPPAFPEGVLTRIRQGLQHPRMIDGGRSGASRRRSTILYLDP
jgi:hypothetical protein